MIKDQERSIRVIAYSDLVGVRDAAAIAGVTTSGLKNRIARGMVVGVRFNERAFVVSALSAGGCQIDRVAFDQSISKLATVEEACRQLGVCEARVPRLVRQGRLDGFLVNPRTWAITRESIDRNASEYDPSSAKGTPRRPGLPGRRRPKKPRRSTAGPESGARSMGTSDAAGAVVDARR
jgi:hypothetical protein